ncbi:MAG: hypothetical protein ACRC10_08925 [Thermoguttaceae bacterium]
MKLFKSVFGRELGSSNAKNPTKKSQINLSIEPLEERQMLSVTPLTSVGTTIPQGGNVELDFIIDSDKSGYTSVGITVTSDVGSSLDPSSIKLQQKNSKGEFVDLPASQYTINQNGSKESFVLVNLASGTKDGGDTYKVVISGDHNTYGSCIVTAGLPGLPSNYDPEKPIEISPLDVLRAQTASAQTSGNWNSTTIQYYAMLGQNMGLSKSDYDPTKSQYQEYFDLNNDGVISLVESNAVSANGKLGKVNMELVAPVKVVMTAKPVSPLTTDPNSTSSMQIEGTVSSNAKKLEVRFDGGKATYTDITSLIASGKFTLTETKLKEIFGTSTDFASGTYKLVFKGTANDERSSVSEFTYEFKYVKHSVPVGKDVVKTAYAESLTGTEIFGINDLVQTPISGLNYALYSITVGGTTRTITHDTWIDLGDKGSIRYTGGTKGSDDVYYGGKIEFKASAKQYGFSADDEDALDFTFVIQDNSGLTNNKSTNAAKVELTIEGTNKTPVLDLSKIKTDLSIGAAPLVIDISEVAKDANVDDELIFGTVKATIGSNTHTFVAGTPWTTPGGTVITLDAVSKKLTINASTSTTVETISLSLTAKDDEGFTTASGHNQKSESDAQTLSLKIKSSPIVSGGNLNLTATEAKAGNYNTHWTVDPKGLGDLKYEIGFDGGTLTELTLNTPKTIAGWGTFTLVQNETHTVPTLIWTTVDPTLYVETNDFQLTFKASVKSDLTNSDSITKKVTITVESVAFEDQPVYMSPNSTPIEGGYIATSKSLVVTKPVDTTVSFTIDSCVGPNGPLTEEELEMFSVNSNGRIIILADDLADFDLGKYDFSITATFVSETGEEDITAIVSLHLQNGRITVSDVNVNVLEHNEDTPISGNANVTVETGDTWSIVEDSLVLNSQVDVGPHNDTPADHYDLTPTEIAYLLSLVDLAKNANQVVITITPDAEYPAMFQFLSEGQTAKLTFAYDLTEERYGFTTKGHFTLTVVGENDRPVLNDVAYSVKADESKTITIDDLKTAGKLSDPDRADWQSFNSVNGTTFTQEFLSGTVADRTLTLTSGSKVLVVAEKIDPANPESALWARELVYTPNPSTTGPFYKLSVGHSAPDEFTMTVKDDSGKTNSVSRDATVSLTVNGVNKTPQFITHDPFVTTERATIKVNVDEIASDVNEDDTLFYVGDVYVWDYEADSIVKVGTVGPAGAAPQSIDLPNGGKLIFSADRTDMTFDPGDAFIYLRDYAKFHATDPTNTEYVLQIWLSVSDDSGAANAVATMDQDEPGLEITIKGLNDVPVVKANFVQDIPKMDAVHAWAYPNDITQWISVDWRAYVNDPDITETDLLKFNIDGVNLLVDGQISISGGEFALTKIVSTGELKLWFRPDQNYIKNGEGTDKTFDYTLIVEDPAGATGSGTMSLSIIGVETQPTVGDWQVLYLSNEDPLVSFRKINAYYTITDYDPANLLIGEVTNDFGGLFEGFVLDNGFLKITPDANLVADFADLNDGDVRLYTLHFTYDTGEAGTTVVSIVKGAATEEVDPTEYTLSILEKTQTPKDGPYTPVFPDGYSVGTVDDPDAITLSVGSSQDAIDAADAALAALELDTHYGINEDGKFWFDPKNLFNFLRVGQSAEIVFDIMLFNEYGLPQPIGVAGKVTVIINGVNDQPVAKDYTVADADAIYVDSTTGMEVPLADLFTDVDIDDTHTIIILGSSIKGGGDDVTLVKDVPVILKSGATLTYKVDAIKGAYLLYVPNGGVSTSEFYSLRYNALKSDVVKFKVKDNSGVVATETSSVKDITFNVKGVNKTPVVDAELNPAINTDNTTGITYNVADIATDANTLDVLSFYSITIGGTEYTSAGTHDVFGTVKGVSNVKIGTITIAANMKSFTFVPAHALNDPDTGLEPYDPTNPKSYTHAMFSFIVTDDSGAANAKAASEDVDVLIKGISHGPIQKKTELVGSLKTPSATPSLKFDDFFGNYTSITFDNVLSGANSQFLKNMTAILAMKGNEFEPGSSIPLNFLTVDEYSPEYDFSPLVLTFTATDAAGKSITGNVTISLTEQFTMSLYVIPVREGAQLKPGDTGTKSKWTPTSFTAPVDEFVATVGESYYLQFWVQDSVTLELGKALTDGVFVVWADLAFDKNIAEINADLDPDEDVDLRNLYWNQLQALLGPIIQEDGTLGVSLAAYRLAQETPITGLGKAPGGWIVVQVQVDAKAAGDPNFNIQNFVTEVSRWQNGAENEENVNLAQIDIVMPKITHKAAGSGSLTALAQSDKEVDGGIYMRTVTKPTTVGADGTVAQLPKDVSSLNEWESHYVELWVKASEADMYNKAFTDLKYNSDYFTATNVELGKYFNIGGNWSIDDSVGLVSGIGGGAGQVVVKDGYILLGRVKFESIGTDNVPWAEWVKPHSLGLELENGSVRSISGRSVSELGKGSKTELWANPYDTTDSGKVNASDFLQFAKSYGKKSSADSVLLSQFDYTKSGSVAASDFLLFAKSYGLTREKVRAGATLSLPSNISQRYVGKQLDADNLAMVGTLLDAANQAWADALGLSKPIDVQLVVRDFGDSSTLGEALILEVDANGVPSKGLITLDDNAAGAGWYSQLTDPVDAGRYDLYTTLLHELGHLYGINTAYNAFNAVKFQYGSTIDTTGHVTNPEDVMYVGLNLGERKFLSTLDVNVIETAYGAARGDAKLHGFAKVPSKMQALELNEGDAAVSPLMMNIANVAEEDVASVADVAKIAEVDGNPADSFGVAVNDVQLNIPVFVESGVASISNTEENAKSLAELELVGLSVALPRIVPNVSQNAIADAAFAGFGSDSEIEFVVEYDLADMQLSDELLQGLA